MFYRSLLVLLLGSFLLAPIGVATAKPTIELVVPDYEYPQDGVSNTIGWAIANNGNIAGTVTTPTTSGFERFADGTFGPVFALPNANTYVRGVNNSNLICGFYFPFGSADAHGFLYDGVTFTTFDVPGETNTYVTGINDAGDFCGYADSGDIREGTAFLNVGGVLTTFTIPGGNSVQAKGLNNLGQVIGTYKKDGYVHAFFRDADGALTYPLKIPGAKITDLNGINDKGLMIGSLYDGTAEYNFVLKLPHSVITYPSPDDVNSFAFRGINNSGTITGSFHSDSDFSFHSFIAQLVR